jgi:5'-3' exonuclease
MAVPVAVPVKVPVAAAGGRNWQDGGVGSLMLLDTASLYYRAFYGVPDTVTAPDGTPVNAVRGLLDMIARLVRGRDPARLIACWDEDWRPEFRVAAVPSYKAHRVAQGNEEQTPPALIPQVPVIREVLDAAGIPVAGASGYEADDVIATLAVAAGQPVDVVTGDRGHHLHRARADQAGDRRRGRGDRAVRDPGPRVCGLRGAARRPE